jgi:hypothetical protein
MKVFMTNPKLDWMLPGMGTRYTYKGTYHNEPTVLIKYKDLTDRVKTEYVCEVKKCILVSKLTPVVVK